jgi:flagellin-specific chaperone FliS
MNALLLQPRIPQVRTQGAVARSYRQQHVEGAGPLQGVLLVYDTAVGACGRLDMARALEALSILRGALDFAHGGEIAVQLQSLYLYCEDRIRSRHFAEPERILRELRSAWAQCAGQVAAVPKGSGAGQDAREG